MVHYISGHLPFILINPIITDKAFSDYCSARHYCVPPKYPSKASFASTHPKHTTAKYPCLYISAIHHFLSLIHISEPTRLGMISYAVFCLKKKKKNTNKKYNK